MNQVLKLHHAHLHCTLLPAMGGCMADLWYDERPVLRGVPAQTLQSALHAASYPLVPYSNRIGRGALLWADQVYQLEPNFLPEPHAIHGVGWQRPWQVDAADATSARLSYVHAADRDWPFAFAASQSFALGPQALTVRFEIRNLGDAPMPAGLGWHPYFCKSMESHLNFAVQGRWEMGPDKLPTHRLAHSGLDTDCRLLDLDHCFDGWSGSLVLHEGGLKITLSSDLEYLVVFTNPARDSIALEPVSHVNNALALATQSGRPVQEYGVRVLQPHESFGCFMQIKVEV